MKKRLLKKRITNGNCWSTLPSARFLLNRRTGETVTDHEMYRLGIPVARVQALLAGGR